MVYFKTSNHIIQLTSICYLFFIHVDFGSPCENTEFASTNLTILFGVGIYIIGEALPELLVLDYSFMKYFITEERLIKMDMNYNNNNSVSLESSFIAPEVCISQSFINNSKSISLEDILSNLKNYFIKAGQYELLDTVGNKKEGLGSIVKAQLKSAPETEYCCRIIELPKISTYLRDGILREYYQYRNNMCSSLVDIEFIDIQTNKILLFYKYYPYSLLSAITLNRHLCPQNILVYE